MKRTLLASATLLALGSTAAMAQSYPNQPRTYQEMAQVISSTPVYERIATPRQQCWTEQVAVNDDRRGRRVVNDGYVNSGNQGASGAGTVLGAVIGGVLGHQFGNTRGGRDHGTVAGAILGGVVGTAIERDSRSNVVNTARGNYDYVDYDRGAPAVRQVQRCNTVNETRDQIAGYDVVYRLHGRDYSTRLAYDPGTSFPVEVEVRPAGYQRQGYVTPSRSPVPSYSRYY